MYEEKPKRKVVNMNSGFWSLKKFFTIIAVIVIIVSGSLATTVSAKQVPTGFTGVLLNWGEATKTLNPGFHWINPIGQEIFLMNTQIQKTEATESSASRDLQEVTTTIAVNYQLDASKVLNIYRELRSDYESRVVKPQIQEALKAATAKYIATELITQRESVKDSFLNILRDRLSIYNIVVLSVSVTNFQFSASFNAAIEAKVTAEQKALEAQNYLAQVEYEAQQQIIKANAQANATVTIAQAEAMKTIITANATAESIRRVNSELANSQAYLEYMEIMQWNGELPYYYGGNGQLPIFTIPIPTNSTTP